MNRSSGAPSALLDLGLPDMDGVGGYGVSVEVFVSNGLRHILGSRLQELCSDYVRILAAAAAGQFEGIRIMFFVFFPMCAGPLLADPICRAFGEKVYQVVDGGSLIFVTACIKKTGKPVFFALFLPLIVVKYYD